MIISFAGHSFVSSKSQVFETVKTHIRDNVVDGESIVFYLGGYGDFNELCARACRELKGGFPNIELVYVTPYLTLREQENIKRLVRSGLYDASIYPNIENAPPKFAISKRNEWMMTNADLVIAYVNHSYGGAYKSLQVAKRRKKRIINICDL